MDSLTPGALIDFGDSSSVEDDDSMAVVNVPPVGHNDDSSLMDIHDEQIEHTPPPTPSVQPSSTTKAVRDVEPERTMSSVRPNRTTGPTPADVERSKQNIIKMLLYFCKQNFLSEEEINALLGALQDALAKKKEMKAGTANSLVTYTIRSRVRRDHYWDQKYVGESTYENESGRPFPDVAIEMQKEGFADTSNTNSRILANITTENMIIYSPYLLEIMPKVVGYYPALKAVGRDEDRRKIKLSRPYRMLAGRRNELAQVREEEEEKVAIFSENEQRVAEYEKAKITVEHIKVLEHEIDKVLKTEMELEREGYLLDDPVASFNKLWILYRPGTLVYTKIFGRWACCMILSPVWTSPANIEEPFRKTLNLNLWFLDFYGTTLDRRTHSVSIIEFKGKRQILRLEAVPVEFADKSPELRSLREKLIQRGKRYIDYLTYRGPQCQYNGYAYSKQEKDKTLSKRYFYKGRVVIDPIFHDREYGPPDKTHFHWDKGDIWPNDHSQGEMAKYVDLDPTDKGFLGRLTDTHYMLLASHIRGMTLGARKWAWLDMDSISDDFVDSSVMEYLQLEKRTLRTLKGLTPKRHLVRRFDDDDSIGFQLDPIHGKGEGRIVLLHGKPGIGKTFTVECLAEESQRPLIRLACNELGLQPETLEDNLWSWFRMAEEWQAILLIDEADVYVKQRGDRDNVLREALVLVFLRSLEYYRGTLFLTTNLTNTFDEAIMSRISPIIRLGNLSGEQCETLVDLYLEKMQGYCSIQAETGQQLRSMLSDREACYTGREIRQVFSTAIAISKGADRVPNSRAGGRLTPVYMTDFNYAIDNLKEFRQYQKDSNNGYSADQMAELHGLRN